MIYSLLVSKHYIGNKITMIKDISRALSIFKLSITTYIFCPHLTELQEPL